MSTDIQSVVVGAGVVGLAVARALAQSGREVLILEAENAFGTQTSARHSEVIHAGIYYEKNSLKARFCVAGKKALYAYCDSHGVEYKRCGKLIVATSQDQLSTLNSIKGKAAANGVHDLQYVGAAEVRELEPSIQCEGALVSPSTGIIDSHGYMLSLLGDAENAGAVIAYESEVLSIDKNQYGYRLSIGTDGEETMELTASEVVNCAGHAATKVAGFMNLSQAWGLNDSNPGEGGNTLQASAVAPVMAKGNYFGLQGACPVGRLIYPVPEVGGLGVHITIDLGGQARFGPDVEWLDEASTQEPGYLPDYDVDPTRADSFYAAIRRYWPELQDGTLIPDYSGLRPKIRVGNALYPDFLVQGPDKHGSEGFVNLFGIESPGLTSSLAIADHVLGLMDSKN